MPRLVLPILLAAAWLSAQPVTVHMIPNTHGTIAGWLVDFDTERNYVLNNYLWHLDRVKSDSNYRFAYSEVPNVVSLLNFAPERLEEIRQLHREKRFEFVNGFFLEPDTNLSGGEALVQMGVLGLSWYDQVFGFRPRHCWMIDLTGTHRQMPQIVTGLGMESIFFTRNNPTNASSFWWISPDGTRTMALVNRHYAEFGGKQSLFTSKEALSDEQLAAIAKTIEEKRRSSPSKNTLFSLCGAEDYSSPPVRESYPTEFLNQWSRRYPDVRLRFSIPSDLVDALQSEIKGGSTRLIEYSGDTGYSWDSFWLNMPEVKQYYRRDEHLLHAAEALSAAASFSGGRPYPSQEFYNSWVNMLINMDRNIIWGAGVLMGFQDPVHWDAWDRFRFVEHQARGAIESSVRSLAGKGTRASLYNPLNWKRRDPVSIQLPPGQVLEGVPCQAAAPGSVVCSPGLPSTALSSFRVQKGSAPAARPAALPGAIENAYYIARVDPRDGTLASLKVKPSGEELLGGPANVILAETVAGMKVDAEHFMHARPKRRLLATSSASPATVSVTAGPLATVVHASSAFHGASRLERTVTFYRDHPRIDFDTRLDLHADDVLVTADFPLAADVVDRSRGIPYGFSSTAPGSAGAILPSIRWSNYQLASGAGLALLDRGLTGHEINGRTVTLGLVNAVSLYMKKPNELLRGQGVREFSYALVPHSASWQKAAVPRLAWEFNAPPVVVTGTGEARQQPIIETSDNVIVEAVRRVGRQIEIRLVETEGVKGDAALTVRLPHSAAALTNLMGEQPVPLPAGPSYRFPVRPQQIVTVRLDTASAVPAPAPIRDYAGIVPPEKRKPLTVRILERGHPGR